MATIHDVAKYAGVSDSTVSKTLRGDASVSEKNREKVLEAIEVLKYGASEEHQPTIKDVADRAGLSISTVSNVLNNKPVGEKSRRLVQSAVAALNYKPNMMGRYLRKEYNTVLVASTYPIQSILKGIFTTARQLDYDIVQMSPEMYTADEFIARLENGMAKGVILINFFDVEMVRFFSERYHVVQCGEHVEAPGSYVVSLDYELAAYELTMEMIAQGKRRIRLIAGGERGEDPRHFVELFQDGVARALAEHGLTQPEPCGPDIGVDAAYNPEIRAHKPIVDQILATPPDRRPDALLAFSSDIASLYVNLFQLAGLRVPDDIAVASLTNSDFQRCIPYVTSVQQPMQRMGAAAMDLMAKLIAGERDQPRYTVIDHKLKLCASTHREIEPFAERVK